MWRFLRIVQETSQNCLCKYRNNIKFYRIVFRVGEKVKPLLKGRIGVVHGSVQGHLTPFHLQLETSARDDIDEQTIINKVSDCIGQNDVDIQLN